MRLIISAKIPNQVDPIPLDIIDDRPTGGAFKDILRLTKLANTEDSLEDYELLRNDKQLDLNKSFTENGVKNGDILDIIRRDQDKADLVISNEPKQYFKATTPATSKKKASRTTIKEEPDSSSIPGVKIDFD